MLSDAGQSPIVYIYIIANPGAKVKNFFTLKTTFFYSPPLPPYPTWPYTRDVEWLVGLWVFNVHDLDGGVAHFPIWLSSKSKYSWVLH